MLFEIFLNGFLALFLLKAFEVGFALDLKQIEQRPSHGTTVSIYGFHEIPPLKKWDISTVCFLIAVIAVTKLEVRFNLS